MRVSVVRLRTWMLCVAVRCFVGPYLCSALLIDKIVGWGRRRVCLVFCVALRGFWLFFAKGGEIFS